MSVLLRTFEKCTTHSIIPIFDDAHCALVEPGTHPVGALDLWLAHIQTSHGAPDWYQVRSLGKQLNCNGWGIGSIAAPAQTLEHLALNVRPKREYAIQAAQQWALAQHLSGPGFQEDTRALVQRVRDNRKALRALLPQFKGLAAQVCTPFSWFPLPEGVRRDQIMKSVGVLLGAISPSPLTGQADPEGPDGLARIYLGVHPEVFSQALARLEPWLRR